MKIKSSVEITDKVVNFVITNLTSKGVSDE